MIEEHTIRIVSKYRLGEGSVKVAAMNLVIVCAKPLDIVVPFALTFMTSPVWKWRIT